MILVLLDEVAVQKARLRELEAKERAHDCYLRATRKMRERAASVELARYGEWNDGFHAALREFAEFVVAAENE